MKHLTSAFLLSLGTLSVLGLGCNPFSSVQDKVNQRIGETVAEKMIQAGSGGKVNVDMKDGSFTVVDKETGTKGSFGFDAKIPENFPSDIPRYEGGQVFLATVSQDGKRAHITEYFYNQDAAKIKDWYVQAFTDLGYERTSQTGIKELGIAEYTKDNVKLTALVVEQKQDDQAAVMVQITRDIK